MRLVTRGDLDGLTSAVIITECEKIDEIRLVHPQDITDKKVTITRDDIFANLPYHPEVGKWFDHHLLTDSNERPPAKFEGRYRLAPSAAHLVYEYYLEKKPEIRRFEKLVAETDRLDTAQLTRDDVLDPKDYILLGFTLDPRTGLGAFQPYFVALVGWLKQMSIQEVLQQTEVQERIAACASRTSASASSPRPTRSWTGTSCSRTSGTFGRYRSATDSSCTRCFPRRTSRCASIPDRTPSTSPRRSATRSSIAPAARNVGELMSRYGGGGHRAAGTCLLSAARAEQQIAELLDAMKRDG